MGKKSHLELRSADALEHDEIMKFRKQLVVERVVSIVCILLLDIGFIAATIACLAFKKWGSSIPLILSTLFLLFLTVLLFKDHGTKTKAIKNRKYMVSEGIVYAKTRYGVRSPRCFLTVENKDGSRGRYRVNATEYNKAKEGASCLIIKYDEEENKPKYFTRDVVICGSKMNK